MVVQERLASGVVVFVLPGLRCGSGSHSEGCVMQQRSVAPGMIVGISVAVIMYLTGALTLGLAMVSVVLCGVAIAIAEAIR